MQNIVTLYCILVRIRFPGNDLFPFSDLASTLTSDDRGAKGGRQSDNMSEREKEGGPPMTDMRHGR